MTDLEEALSRAPHPLRDGLEWFHSRRGTEIGWPTRDEIPASLDFVVTSAKGIYKPKGVEFALSVRQTLKSPYADRPIVRRSNGGWVYGYHQEGHDADPTQDARNRALLANMRARVPVAVLMQTESTPPVRYRVEGLALVARYSAGFFFLEGFTDDGQTRLSAESSEDAVVEEEAIAQVGSDFAPGDSIDPDHDARVWTTASVVRRQGQGEFRRSVLEAYGGTCAITGCQVAHLLDAAHVLPYRGSHTNHLSNGLLLRTDVHTLFDRGLLAVEPDSLDLVVAASIDDDFYRSLHGRQLAVPADAGQQPSRENLRSHLEWCGDRLL